MFGKSTQKRINETLTMIQNAPDLTGPVRVQVATFVGTMFPRLTAADLQDYDALSGEMSVKAHIAPNVAKGSEAERETRRAIFLLWKAVGKAQAADVYTTPRAAKAMTMQPMQLPAAFSEVMLRAGVTASIAGGQYAVQQMMDHPARFLRDNRLLIAGSNVGADRLSTAPDGNYQNVLNFHFQYDAGGDKFLIAVNKDPMLGESYVIAPVSVAAIHWSQVPHVGAVVPYGFTDVRGCELTGSTLMVTTQFTGCAFSWTNQGGVVRASHISPSGGGIGTYPGGGTALAQALTHGTMSNAGNLALNVFGAGAGNAPPHNGGASFYPDPVNNVIRWVTIIGVDKGGTGWRLYAQVATGVTAHIQDARRIM